MTPVDFLAERYNYINWMRNRDEISAATADEWRAKFFKQAKEMEEQQLNKAWQEIEQARGLNIPIKICSDKITEDMLKDRERKQRLRVAIVEAIISNCEITQKKTGEAQYEISQNDLEKIILEITNAVMKDEI